MTRLTAYMYVNSIGHLISVAIYKHTHQTWLQEAQFLEGREAGQLLGHPELHKEHQMQSTV